MNDEFYIGWEERAPRSHSRWVRSWIVLASILVTGLSIALAMSQSGIGEAVFEWNMEREFEGVLRVEPVPHLVIGNADGTRTTHLLVNPWKFGFDPVTAAAWKDRSVRLKGKTIARGTQRMIEVRPDSVRPAGEGEGARRDAPVPEAGADRDERWVSRTLRGEIVDSKCWLGVMNPGRLATHRGCAVRCLSGGIPPILLVQYASGRTEHYLMVGSDGRALNREILEFVAEPVEIRGEVRIEGDLRVLRAEPSDIRRLDGGQ